MAEYSAHYPKSAFSHKAWDTFQRYVEDQHGVVGVAAFIGGSVARGVAQPGSDVDGVIITPDGADKPLSQRKKITIDGIPLDLAVFNMTGLKRRLEGEYRRANPWVMDIVAMGPNLFNPRSNTAVTARSMARDYVRKGPPEFTPRQQRSSQVELTELADSLRQSTDPKEQRFIASMMVPKLAGFHLRSNKQWIGSYRRLLTRLRDMDKGYADRLDTAVHQHLAMNGKTEPLLQLTLETLAPAGGFSRDFDTETMPALPSAKPSKPPGPGKKL